MPADERSYPDEEDYGRYMWGIGLLIDPDDGLVRRRLYYSYLLGGMFPQIMMEVLKQHWYGNS